MAQSVEGRPGADARVEVSFLLLSPTARSLGVRIEFSEDRGQSYSTASLEPAPGSPGALPADPSGVPHSVVWQAGVDLSDLNQHDLRVRVTPYDAGSGAQGIRGESAVFGLGSNSPPQLSAVTPPAGRLGGWVSLTFTVSDADGDHVALSGEYSLDGGGSFLPATLGRGGGTGPLEAPPGGAAGSIAWHAQGDVPESVRSGVRVRLRASDTAPGPFASSGSLDLDTRAPVVNLLTLNAIPREMNGSVPFTNTSGQSEEFELLAPRWGFVVWVGFSSVGAAADAGGLRVSASVPLGGGAAGGGLEAGGDLGHLFGVNPSTGLATFMLGSVLACPEGSVALTAELSDVLGNVSLPAGYSFRAGEATADKRPFESPERWHLDFLRDNFSISSTTDSSGTVTVTSRAGASGVRDFVEDLRVLGLQSASPPQPAVDARLNEVVLAAVQDAVVARLNELYGRFPDGSAGPDSTPIDFRLSAPAGSHSRIAIGGDDPLPGFTIGRAEFDYRNSFTNDDSAPDLGIFVTNLIQFYINSSFTFRLRFDALIPGRGTPLGFHADDVAVLDPSFQRTDPGNTTRENRRFDDLAVAIDSIARATAVILAHEIGHSLGLVANGPPPAGLFGGETQASFAGPHTNLYHLDTSANDLMGAAMSFTGAVATGAGAPRFTELMRAYLVERILLE